jgi:hypothetical protein
MGILVEKDRKEKMEKKELKTIRVKEIRAVPEKETEKKDKTPTHDM